MNRLVKLILCLLPWGKPADPDPTPDPAPAPAPPPKPLPEIEQNIAYGDDPLNRYDVHRPPNTFATDSRKVVDLVHGGGWQNPDGDKANPGVIANKVAWLLSLGYIVISYNYRLWTPDNGVTPLVEAQDVARGIAHAQRNVLGADPRAHDLMGHSAGAQLVAQIGASPTMQRDAGMLPVNKIVCLDPGGLKVDDAIAAANATRDPKLIAVYAPFGTDKTKWGAMSPFDNLATETGPWFLVYSTLRGKGDAKQANNFAMRIEQFGGKATPYPVALEHGEINDLLGLPSEYTTAVQKFLLQA